MQLTPRLEAAVSLIPKGSVIADIGTDHAYIPVYTCETGWCPSASDRSSRSQAWMTSRR